MTGLLARRRARRDDRNTAIDIDAADWLDGLLPDDDAPAHPAGAHPHPSPTDESRRA